MPPSILKQPSSDNLGVPAVSDRALYSLAPHDISSSELEMLFDPLVSILAGKKTLAIAVSGGADSMALCLLAADWVNVTGGQVVALIVDHGLRTSSATEVQKVAGWLAIRGIPYKILTWEGKKPVTGVQAAARIARYDLMRDWCGKSNISVLMVAHHLEDQVETFLLRVSGGSGLDGLASMKSISKIGKLFILRPLLGTSKKRLIQSLRLVGQRWIEDPSNQNPAFERTKMRQLVMALEECGLPPPKVADLVNHFSELQKILANVVTKFFECAVRVLPEGYGVVHHEVLQKLPDPILERTLIQLILIFGAKIYPPRRDSLTRVIENIKSSKISSFTLGGCRFIEKGSTLFICRDQRAITVKTVTAGFSLNWDGLFDVEIAGPSGGEGKLGALGENGWHEIVNRKPELKVNLIPYPVRITLPALFDMQGVVHVPGLDYQRQGEKSSSLKISKLFFKPVKHRKLT
jgi:tRNA(Ile)-lysidine synthase